MAGALILRLLAMGAVFFNWNSKAMETLVPVCISRRVGNFRGTSLESSKKYRSLLGLSCKINDTRSGSDGESNDPIDTINSNATLKEAPNKNNGQKSYYVSTSAFLMATFLMVALVAVFVAQCDKPSTGARNVYTSSRSITESCEDDDISLSIDDRQSDTSSKNTLFLHVIHNPQNISRNSSFQSCPPDLDECD